MLGADYKEQNCSIARALELVGERWTVLILRDIFLGVRRFEALRSDLGVARNVLAARLERLVAEGVLEKRLYQSRPPRHEYRLTDKGLDLWPVIFELMQWGDRYASPPEGPPVVIRHRGCGGVIGERRVCGRCSKAVGIGDVRAELGPGAAGDYSERARAIAAAASG